VDGQRLHVGALPQLSRQRLQLQGAGDGAKALLAGGLVQVGTLRSTLGPAQVQWCVAAAGGHSQDTHLVDVQRQPGQGRQVANLLGQPLQLVAVEAEPHLQRRAGAGMGRCLLGFPQPWLCSCVTKHRVCTRWRHPAESMRLPGWQSCTADQPRNMHGRAPPTMAVQLPMAAGSSSSELKCRLRWRKRASFPMLSGSEGSRLLCRSSRVSVVISPICRDTPRCGVGVGRGGGERGRGTAADCRLPAG
jgi:hypothetical protein